MIRKKDNVTISFELFTKMTADLIEKTIQGLKQSAQETGLNAGERFIGEMLLLTTFSARLANSIFKEDDNTVNTDNESEVTL